MMCRGEGCKELRGVKRPKPQIFLGNEAETRSGQMEGLAGLKEVEGGAAVGEGSDGSGVIDLDGGEGIVMNAEHVFDVEPLGGDGGVFGAHGEVVADGEGGEAEGAGVGEQFDVRDESGITGVVESTFRRADDKAAGVAAVGAVGEFTAVGGRDVFGGNVTEFNGAAEVHADGGGDALFGQPVGDLVVADDGAGVFFGKISGVGDMIGVAVREEDDIGLDRVEVGGARRWIGAEEGIEEEGLVGGLDLEAGVAKEGNVHG